MTSPVRELLNRYGDVHQLFVYIDAATRKQLDSIAIAQTLSDEKEIGNVGELVDGLYLIVEGTVRVSSLSMDGDQFYVGTTTGGELHGLASVMDEKPSLHLVRVVGAATVGILPAASFRNLVYTNRQLCEKVVKLLCDRVSIFVCGKRPLCSNETARSRCSMSRRHFNWLFFNERNHPRGS